MVPPLLILASSVCKFLPCLIFALTQESKGGHLFRLTCSAVLWRRRDTENKYCWHMWGVLTVDGPHWVCHSPMWHVFPRSTQFSLQSALQEHCPKWALRFVHFSGLSHSGSQVLCKGTDPDGLWVLPPSQVQDAQVTGCLVSTLSQVDHWSYAPPWSQTLSFLGVPWRHSTRCAVYLLWGADLRLWHSWQMWTIQDTRNT